MKRKRRISAEDSAELDARAERTLRLLDERITYHLEKLREERGLDRTPTREEVTAEVEAKIRRATGD